MGEFEEALRENPDHIDAINNIAMQYAQDGRYADALNLLRRGEQLWPRHFTTRYNIGYVLLRMNLARRKRKSSFLASPLAIDSDHDGAALQPRCRGSDAATRGKIRRRDSGVARSACG